MRAILVAGALLIVAAAVGSYELYHQAAAVPLEIPMGDRIGRNAPFIKSADVVVDKMVEVAELTPDDVVYDLGCGDGRIVITAALQSGCHGVGFDIDPERVAEARENVKLHGVEDLVEIREQDIFAVDLSNADVVMCYLLPWMVKKLIPQLQQMKPGSEFISHDFSFGDIKYIPSDATYEVPLPDKPETHLVHIWKLPLHVPAKD